MGAGARRQQGGAGGGGSGRRSIPSQRRTPSPPAPPARSPAPCRGTRRRPALLLLWLRLRLRLLLGAAKSFLCFQCLCVMFVSSGVGQTSLDTTGATQNTYSMLPGTHAESAAACALQSIGKDGKCAGLRNTLTGAGVCGRWVGLWATAAVSSSTHSTDFYTGIHQCPICVVIDGAVPMFGTWFS